MKQRHTKIYILMILAAICWASAFIAGKFSVPYIPVCTLTFMRFAIATVFIYGIRIVLEKSNADNVYRYKKKDLPKFLFTGIVGMVGYHLLFFTSLNYTTAINSSIIGAANPIVTVVLAVIFLRQSIPLRQIIGVALSLTGVVLTITAGDITHLGEIQFNKGDLIMCAAVVMWAAYGVYSKAKCVGIPPVAITYYSFLVCTIVLIPFVLWERPWEFLGDVPWSAYAAVGFMAVLPSCFAYLVQQMAIQEIGPSRTSIFVNLVPIFSSILAVTILHEVLQPIKILTALFIIAGVFICQMSGNTREEKTIHGK